MAFGSEVSQDASVGSPGPSYLLSFQDNEDGAPCFLHREFGVSTVGQVIFEADFWVNNVGGHSFAGFGVLRTTDGAGPAVVVDKKGGTWNLSIGVASEWRRYGSMTTVQEIGAVAIQAMHHMLITATVNADRTITVVAVVTRDGAQIGTATANLEATTGGQCGVYGVATEQWGNFAKFWVDNIRVRGSGSTDYTVTNIATAYVYTYTNDLDQESAPSPASATILRPDGVSVTVTTPTSLPASVPDDIGVTKKTIYRAVSGGAGTAFLLVAEIPLGQADYVDALDDEALGDPLPSTLWAPPPKGLRGIMALPNEVMAGFVGNQLCFSAQGYPHAWPVEYRLTVDTDIVAIGNIDTTVVIGTSAFVYLAIGTDPATYSMTKLEVPQACVSKQSLAYLTGIGVVFASPDGLIAVAGAGQIRNLTSSTFTREQWQAIKPETIQAVSHDDVYWMFSEVADYVLDMKADGFGLVELGFHATASHADPLTDKLYLVLNQNAEPVDAMLPEPSTAVTPNGTTIYEFNAPTGAGKMVYRWLGKLNLLEYPAAFVYCQVKAEDYENLVLRLYGDRVLLVAIRITGEAVFTLPVHDAYTEFEIELVGTSVVRTVQVSEDVGELQ